MRVAVVTTRAPNNDTGGAERLYTGLVNAFKQQGWDAEEISLFVDETTFGGILDGYAAAEKLNLFSYDLVVSTKAPTYAVKHPNHACWLVHTMRVFYDQFAATFPSPSEEILKNRDLIHLLDTKALSRTNVRLFSIGETVDTRLKLFNDLGSQVIHPPVPSNIFRPGVSEGYFFIPSRLHRWKRLDLIIDAFRKLQRECCLRISGDGEEASALAAQAAASPNITFLGHITDEELVRQYRNCLAVPFTPIEEDYGYVTIEAFLSGKPVITTEDSGEAAQIVSMSGAGVVVKNDADRLAEALLSLWQHPNEAARLGQIGQRWAESMDWRSVVRSLASHSEDLPQ